MCFTPRPLSTSPLQICATATVVTYLCSLFSRHGTESKGAGGTQIPLRCTRKCHRSVFYQSIKTRCHHNRSILAIHNFPAPLPDRCTAPAVLGHRTSAVYNPMGSSSLRHASSPIHGLGGLLHAQKYVRRQIPRRDGGRSGRHTDVPPSLVRCVQARRAEQPP